MTETYFVIFEISGYLTCMKMEDTDFQSVFEFLLLMWTVTFSSKKSKKKGWEGVLEVEISLKLLQLV